MSIYYLILLGLVAGTLAGLLGVGGGLLFTPVLFYVFSHAGVEDPFIWAIASSLLCTFISAFSSSIRQYFHNNFFAREGVIIGVLGAIGTTLGRWITTSGYYSQEQFAVIFSFLLLYVAYSFIQRSRRSSAKHIHYNPDTDYLNFKRSSVVGGLGGIVASLAGIGGGGVMVPLMNIVYRVSLRKAISVSSLAIVFISLSGWLQFAVSGHFVSGMTSYTWGYVDFGAALPLVFGGFVGGFAGVYVNHLVKQSLLQWIFAILALALAARLLWDVFG